MPLILVLNPGSASLKIELIDVSSRQVTSADGKKLFSATIEGIGKGKPELLVFKNRQVEKTEELTANSFNSATRAMLQRLEHHLPSGVQSLKMIDLIAVRVVHGADEFDSPVLITEDVRRAIEQHKIFAPLHNQKSLDVIDAVAQASPQSRIAAAFDTAFHRTLPEHAWRYPIDRAVADKHKIRRYGFHGFSHRYMMERYAQLIEKHPDHVNLVTLHLESGCSATAIQNGRSIDNSMGVTPLEGLMMGTRCGSVDPAVVQLLMQEEQMDLSQAMELLNKRSGLLAISGSSIDTRVLVKEMNTKPASALAMEMFAYRLSQYSAAYLATVSDPEAIIFGGGIGEDTPWVRANVCAKLKGFGVVLDENKNARALLGDARISRDDSRVHAYAIGPEEGMQIAFESARALLSS